MSISLFDTVEPIHEKDNEFFGKMVVIEIRDDNECEFYGTYPFMCRSENLSGLHDFKESELQIVEE